MKIGFLTTSYPRHDGDSAGLFVRGMARALRDRGHQLEVLAPAASGGITDLSDPNIEVRAVRYASPSHLQRTFYGAGAPDNLRRDLMAWPGALTFPVAQWAAARRCVENWDAVVSHWAIPSGFVGASVRGSRPHLSVLHSADVHLMGRTPGRGRLFSTLAAGSNHLLFASAALRRKALSWLPSVTRARVAGKCHASAMGIAPTTPRESRTSLRAQLSLRLFTLVFVGRLVPIKGLAAVIEALAADSRFELVIVGDGPERLRLAALARDRRANVRFVGSLPPKNRDQYLHAADAFVMPSVQSASGRTEGTPTAALEAAHAALPIVASLAAEGLIEVFGDNETALFVKPESAQFRRAFRTLLHDATLRQRLGTGAQEIAKRYAWDAIAPHIEFLLSQG